MPSSGGRSDSTAKQTAHTLGDRQFYIPRIDCDGAEGAKGPLWNLAGSWNADGGRTEPTINRDPTLLFYLQYSILLAALVTQI